MSTIENSWMTKKCAPLTVKESWGQICIHEDSTTCHDCLVRLRANNRISWDTYKTAMEYIKGDD